MIQSRARGLYNAISVALCAILVIVFWGYLFLLNLVGDEFYDLSPERYLTYCLIALIGLLIHLVRTDETQYNVMVQDVFRGARLAFRQTLYVAGAVMFTLLLTKDQGISRLFFFTFLPVLWAALTVANTTLPVLLCKWFFTGRHAYKTLLIGPASRVGRVRRWMNYVSRFGVHCVGIVTDASKRKTVLRVPVLGTTEDLPRLLDETGVNLVVLLELPQKPEQLERILNETENRGVRLITVNNQAEVFRHSVRYFTHYGVDFMTLREEPLEDPVARLMKRAVDVAFSLPVVVFVLPVLALLVAAIHRKNSPGPLFFRQLRTGIGNRPFEIYKFRTMCVDHDDHAKQATQADDRIFFGGRFLRRTSIDEFPQFLNVLRGEMSLVGPRPHMLEHDAVFAKVMASYNVRSLVKPGITGLAQIRGFRGEARSNDDIRRRVECDIEYIENWSIVVDAYILLKTVLHVIRPPKTAY